MNKIFESLISWLAGRPKSVEQNSTTRGLKAGRNIKLNHEQAARDIHKQEIHKQIIIVTNPEDAKKIVESVSGRTPPAETKPPAGDAQKTKVTSRQAQPLISKQPVPQQKQPVPQQTQPAPQQTQPESIKPWNQVKHSLNFGEFGACPKCEKFLGQKDWEARKIVRIKQVTGVFYYCLPCLQKAPLLNETADTYRLLASIGSDSFGEYFIADKGDDQASVLKRLSMSLPKVPTGDPRKPKNEAEEKERQNQIIVQWKGMLERVKRSQELEIGSLDLVVKAYGFEEYPSQDYLYYCMDYSPALTVKQMLEEDGPVPHIDQILRNPKPVQSNNAWQKWFPVLYHTAYSLYQLHEKGIVHRDVKPAHLLCTADGRTLLSGFAMAKYKENQDDVIPQDMSETFTGDFAMDTLSSPEEEKLSRTGKTLGTGQYMSPEQIWDAKNVKTSADLWSYSVVAFEVLTRCSMFHKPNPMACMRAIDLFARENRFETVKHKIPEDVPPEFVAILERCFRQNPDDRQTAEEIVRVMSNLIKENNHEFYNS